MSGLDVFDTTVQKSHDWMNELMQELQTDNKHFAYTAFRSVVHALRDRLYPEECVHLGAQLPMLLRGMYYEGWRPSETPSGERRAEEFLGKVADGIPRRPDYDAERVVRAVFTVLNDRISEGEIEDVVGSLPEELREFWIGAPVASTGG